MILTDLVYYQSVGSKETAVFSTTSGEWNENKYQKKSGWEIILIKETAEIFCSFQLMQHFQKNNKGGSQNLQKPAITAHSK